MDFGINDIYFFPFSLFVSVYVYASVCDFVCIALLLPFVLGFCLSLFIYLFIYFVYFVALVIIGGFVFGLGCSFLSFFPSFSFSYYFLIF